MGDVVAAPHSGAPGSGGRLFRCREALPVAAGLLHGVYGGHLLIRVLAPMAARLGDILLRRELLCSSSLVELSREVLRSCGLEVCWLGGCFAPRVVAVFADASFLSGGLERILVQDAGLRRHCWCSACACLVVASREAALCVLVALLRLLAVLPLAFKVAEVRVGGLERKLCGQLRVAPTTATFERSSAWWERCCCPSPSCQSENLVRLRLATAAP
ncbi:hypothetical protein U9M48_018264 [Paspalum notatum var. saurae]|uniref:Uncharacterized protein n=1 Tax=Paspalum notatum var. saurae TaxID=547442 RepID=A0AAQ3T9T1_PASNO